MWSSCLDSEFGRSSKRPSFRGLWEMVSLEESQPRFMKKCGEGRHLTPPGTGVQSMLKSGESRQGKLD